MGGEFYPAAQHLQYPDILASYVRGQQAPLVTQGLQQENTQRGLQIDQLRQTLLGRQLMAQAWMPQGASAQGGATGGIQNGPQGAVGAETSPQMAAPPQGSTYAGSQPTISAGTQAAVGILSPDMAKLIQGTALTGGNVPESIENVQKFQRQQGQLQWSMDNTQYGEAFGRHMATSPDAPKALQANWKSLGPIWLQTAFATGMDARDMSPHNVNKLAAMIYNQKAIPLGMTPIAAPAHWQQQNVGFGGTQQVEEDTGERKPGLAREMPVKVGERQDPDTGQTVAVYKNWVGGAGGAPSGAAGTGNAAGTTDVPVGQPAPSPDQTRAAGLAMSMRTGLDNLRQLEQKGFAFTPADRAAVVGVISEQGGPLGIITGGALSSLPLQELLAHKLSPDGQTYLASLMPVLQGIGHHLGGQRLNDVQIKALLESIAPINTKNQAAMQQINANRNGYYSGLLLEAGPARESPVFGGALKADYAKFAAPKTVTQAQVADYAQTHRITLDAARRHVEANGFTVK